jgi:hypothetical protein
VVVIFSAHPPGNRPVLHDVPAAASRGTVSGSTGEHGEHPMNTAKKAALVIAAAGIAAGASGGSAFAHSADAHGRATNSPGVGSGNLAQLPVNVPVNATGNSASVVGALNPAFGDHTDN